MYENIAPDFLKTYSHSKQEELLKEVREHRLGQQILDSQKVKKRLNSSGRATPALRWLTFIRQHI
jgi:hypothetical protein